MALSATRGTLLPVCLGVTRRCRPVHPARSPSGTSSRSPVNGNGLAAPTALPTTTCEMLAVGQLLGDVAGQPGVLHGVPATRILGDVGSQFAKLTTQGALVVQEGYYEIDKGTLTAATQSVTFNPGAALRTWSVELRATNVPTGTQVMIKIEKTIGGTFWQQVDTLTRADLSDGIQILTRTEFATQIKVTAESGFPAGASVIVSLCGV